MFIPTLIGVSLVIFILLRVIPGDVAVAILAGPSGEGVFTEEDIARVTEELGLDRPIYIQYVDWMWGLIRGDLGNSFVVNKPIFEQLKRQFPVTLQLGILTFHHHCDCRHPGWDHCGREAGWLGRLLPARLRHIRAGHTQLLRWPIGGVVPIQRV